MIYSWRRYRNFRPYAKGLAEFGGISWSPKLSMNYYDHDTRTVTVVGGGFEYRVYQNIWARADYEYQSWPNLLGYKRLDPQGFTVGAMYHFGHGHFHSER